MYQLTALYVIINSYLLKYQVHRRPPFLGKLVTITIKKEYKHLQERQFLEDVTLAKHFILAASRIKDTHIEIRSDKIKGSFKYWIVGLEFIEEIKLVKSIFI